MMSCSHERAGLQKGCYLSLSDASALLLQDWKLPFQNPRGFLEDVVTGRPPGQESQEGHQVCSPGDPASAGALPLSHIPALFIFLNFFYTFILFIFMCC